MKIFMATDITSYIMTVKIINDSGEIHSFTGKYCDDHMTVYGCELYKGAQEDIMAWLSKSRDKDNE